VCIRVCLMFMSFNTLLFKHRNIRIYIVTCMYIYIYIYIYIYTHTRLTPFNMVLLKNLTVAQPAKKFPAYRPICMKGVPLLLCR
jgi:hypothetical protein